MSPLFLSHHPPSQYGRCIRVGRHHLCRRCAVLYPLAFAVAIASVFGAHWPEPWDRTLLYLLPLPMTLEFVIERFGGIRYNAGRQLLLTVLAAPALWISGTNGCTIPPHSLKGIQSTSAEAVSGVIVRVP